MKRYLEIIQAAEMVLGLTEAAKPKFPKGPGLGTIGYGVNLDDPKRFVGSQNPLKPRKTDAMGNLVAKPNRKAWSATRQITKAALDTAKDMIMTLSIKPVGIKIEVMGRERDGKPRSMFIKKAMKLGRETYTSMSGKEVELKAAGTGLQVLDKASRRILLDRGEDMLWD
jgi:hypothetical protein